MSAVIEKLRSLENALAVAREHEWQVTAKTNQAWLAWRDAEGERRAAIEVRVVAERLLHEAQAAEPGGGEP